MDDPTPEHTSSTQAGPARRSNEFWLALTSILAAFVVGAIAAGSGWYAVGQHDGQETARLKLSATRSQQRDAYTAFIDSASDLAVAIQLQVKAIENRYPYFLHTPIPQDRADFDARFTDVGHVLNSAQLYGSDRVRDASNKVFEAAAHSRTVIIGWGMTHPADNPESATCPELLVFENETEVNRQKLADAIDRFNDAAREDLGLAALPPTSTPPEPLLPKDACVNPPH